MFKGLSKCRLSMKYDHVYALCCKNVKMLTSASKGENSEYCRYMEYNLQHFFVLRTDAHK